MAQFSELKEKFPEKKIAHAEKFPFLGEELTLRFVPTPLKTVFFSRYDLFLQMHVPEPLWKTLSEDEMQSYFPALKKFYRREAEKLIRERMQIWAAQMQLFPNQVKFKNQKTRWGSCSSRGVININWRLIGAPMDVIDYILVHELAHLAHMNHSGAFWGLVQGTLPEYPKAEVWLKENHGALDFLL